MGPEQTVTMGPIEVDRASGDFLAFPGAEPAEGYGYISEPVAATPSADGGDDVMAQLERIGALRDAGVLTEEEFAAKKAELLRRLRVRLAPSSRTPRHREVAGLPCWLSDHGEGLGRDRSQHIRDSGCRETVVLDGLDPAVHVVEDHAD